MLKLLLPCLGKYKKYAFLAPLTMVGEVLLEIIIPYLMSKIIDVGIANGDITYVVQIGLLMVGIAVVSLLLGVLSGKFAAAASTGFAQGLRKKLFDKIQDFSFANTDKYSTASLITRLTTDVTNTQMAFMMTIRIAVRAPFMLIFATIMAVSINAQLSTVFFVAIPLLGLAGALIISKAYPRFRKMLKKYDQMNASVQENLIAMRVVKAFVRREYENKNFTGDATELQIAQKKAEKIVIFNMPIMMFAMYGCMIAIAWFGGNMIIQGNMMTGQLMSFISYISQILFALMMISMIFVMLVLSKASFTRILEVLREEIDIKDTEADKNLKVHDGSIQFENVSFAYGRQEKNLTLENINLSVLSGETIGIIGGTGSGKTSLVQLIPRLYDVAGGKVTVGGRDVRDYTLEELRNNVAMVLQNNVLFTGTIIENLRWGNKGATMEEIEWACKAAQAYDFIQSFPNGFETVLGQGGVNLSGGQKQRLCIARALLKKPRVIILDDSTSAVDTATDSKIRQAFRETLRDTTTLIIAQRIASVIEADRIVVLNDGKIDDVGTHSELLQRNKIYREVFESQQKGVA